MKKEVALILCIIPGGERAERSVAIVVQMH